MTSLFPSETYYPPGFEYIPHFLNENEETELLQEISKIDLHTFIFQGFEAKRKVASFGFDYSFDNRKLTAGKKYSGCVCAGYTKGVESSFLTTQPVC